MKIIFLSILLAILSINAKTQTEDIVLKAMENEMIRSINELKLDNLEKSFYISYTVGDIELSYIGASLGAITEVQNSTARSLNTNLLVGDYQRANNNFLNTSTLYRWNPAERLPIEDNYDAIRRMLWKSTDRAYKFAAEIYEAKISAINSRNISEFKLNLPDFSKPEALQLEIPRNKQNTDIEKWKNKAVEISSIFKDYEEIFESHVSIYFYNSYIRFISTESIEVKYPLTYAVIMVTAETIADDGEKLFDHTHYFATNPEDLPDINSIKTDVKFIAEKLTEIRNAPIFEDYYVGPVIIETQALGEYIINQVLGSPSSLLARRVPITQNERIANAAGVAVERNRLEMRMDRRIMDRGISISSNPLKKEYEGVKLFGYYPVDAQGVIPQKTTLVENGILKNFISNLTPTRTTDKSTGGQRISLASTSINKKLDAGVIKIEADDYITNKDMKQKLIDICKYEDLDYGIIIRKFEYDVSERTRETRRFNEAPEIGRPIYIYKVNLEDGSEQLIRGAKVNGLNIRSLNRIEGVSGEKMIYNSLKAEHAGLSRKGLLHGTPMSIISPNAILFKELEIEQDRSSSVKLPIVKSPLLR